jgi:SAM-dependent methyltransferase
LKGKQFDLITCFDVLEHLENPIAVLETFRELLSPNGKVLVSVPNGSTLFELAFRADLILARAMKKPLRPGEPHLQRNSPKKWVSIINRAGLKVAQHDMQIGFFANTAFALVQLPTFLTARLLRKVGLNFDAQLFVDRVCTKARMERLNRVDINTKQIFRPLFGWNLFVLTDRGATI